MARKIKQENPFEEMDPVLDPVEVVNQPEPDSGEVLKEDSMCTDGQKESFYYRGGADDRLEMPSAWSEERTEFLLNKLNPKKEVFDGRPKHNGLRRLVSAYVGKIIKTRTKFWESFTQDFRAACTVTVWVQEYDTGDILSFSGSADVNPFNIDKDFRQHATCTVETRARSRAWKECLNLDVLAAEEMAENTVPVPEVDDYYKDLAPPDQMAVIDNLCSKNRLDIDAVKFISQNKDIGYKRISQITKGQARELIKRLNDYQREIKPIPESIKNYKQNWLNGDNNS